MSDDKATAQLMQSMSSHHFRYSDLVRLPLTYVKNVFKALFFPPLLLICFILRKVISLKDFLRRRKPLSKDRATLLYCLTVCDYLKVAIVLALSHSGYSFLPWIICMWAFIEGSAIWGALVKLICLKLHIPWSEKTPPAFTFLNPDSEPLDWLNNLLGMMWRNSLRGFVKNDIMNLVNLLIEREMQGAGCASRLMHPKLLSLDLGESPPCISSITVYKARDESLTLDLGLDTDIRADARGQLNGIVPFGLSRLNISAPLRLKISPLLRDLFVFGQLNCSLLSLPALDFELSGFTSLLSVTPIKPLVRGLLMQSLATAVVQPKKLIIPNKAVKIFSDHLLAATKPIGLLRVHLKEGQKLRAVDQHTIGFSKADPYCIICLGKRLEKTHVMKKNENPQFDFFCEFPVTEEDYKNEELRFYVKEFQWGFWNDDLNVGYTTVGVRQVVNKESVEEIYRLAGCRDGMLQIAMQFVPVVEPMPNELGLPTDGRESHAIFSLIVFDVSMNHARKPMVVLEMSGRPPVVSSTGNASKNWEFAEEFFFPVQDIGTDKLTISLVDYDSKVSVKNATKKGLRAIRNFVAASDAPQSFSTYKRDEHQVLGKITKDVCSFNGEKETLILDSSEGDVYQLTLAGKIFGLKA